GPGLAKNRVVALEQDGRDRMARRRALPRPAPTQSQRSGITVVPRKPTIYSVNRLPGLAVPHLELARKIGRMTRVVGHKEIAQLAVQILKSPVIRPIGKRAKLDQPR